MTATMASVDQPCPSLWGLWIPYACPRLRSRGQADPIMHAAMGEFLVEYMHAAVAEDLMSNHGQG